MKSCSSSENRAVCLLFKTSVVIKCIGWRAAIEKPPLFGKNLVFHWSVPQMSDPDGNPVSNKDAISSLYSMASSNERGIFLLPPICSVRRQFFWNRSRLEVKV